MSSKIGKDKIFDNIADYFFTKLYIDVYKLSATMDNGRSITDNYLERISNYVKCVNTIQDCYHHVVKGLHERMAAKMPYKMLNFADFVDSFAAIFCPADYYDLLTRSHKDEILYNIICHIVGKIAQHLTTQECISCAIDNRTDVTTEMMRNKMHNITITELNVQKTSYYNKFMSQNCMSQDMISRETAEYIKQELNNHIEELSHANDTIAALNADISMLKDKMKIMEAVSADTASKEEKYKKIIMMLNEKIKSFANTVNKDKAVIEYLDGVVQTSASSLKLSETNINDIIYNNNVTEDIGEVELLSE